MNIKYPAGKNKYALMTIGMFALIFVSFNPQAVNKDNSKSKDNPDSFPQKYIIVSPKMPADAEFAGENVPLHSFDIRERLDRELIVNTYWHSATILSLKRSSRWFPVIEQILEKNDIPGDFKYMAVVESNLTNTVSPKGATGFWQLMKDAAKKYGLEVNKIVDERYNVEKSTEAACKYLKNAYGKFGSWTMAAASYNLGMNGMQEQIERQKSRNYYNLVLNEETSRFIFRILAYKEIFQNPTSFGFQLEENDYYPPLKFYIMKINKPVVHFADFAFKYGINYKILKLYNPWLRENYLPNKKRKTYLIKLPVDAGSLRIPEH